MKRIAQILIIMSLLLVSTLITNVNSNSVISINHQKNETTQSISANQVEDPLNGDLSRPYLDSVYNSTTSSILPATRERNASQGHGAIHEMGIYQNVTVRYNVVNGDENTTVRLYLDAPLMNFTETQTHYSLDLNSNTNDSIIMKYVSSSIELENITLPYDKGLGELVHVNVSTYEAEFNMTAKFIRYFAAIDEANYETLENAPFNFVTTQQYWTTESVDEFYIQTEQPDINIIANKTTATDIYGIAYRTSPTDQFIRINYSIPVATPLFTENITLPEFSLGVTIEWFSYSYLEDVFNGTTKTVLIERTEYKKVTMEDGTPSLFTSIDSQHVDKLLIGNTLYSQSNDINVSISASVVKGQIVSFNLTFGEENSSLVQLDLNGNISREGDFFNFTQSFETGKHIVFLAAFTDKGIEINETYTVIIDQTPPSVTLKEKFDQTQVISTSGKVTFVFNFSDGLSGVREAVLDLGDGTTVEVTNINEYTYNYLEFNEIGYIITLTIIDFSGNVIISDPLQIKIIAEPIGNSNAPNTEFWLLLSFVGIVLIVYKFREEISNILGR